MSKKEVFAQSYGSGRGYYYIYFLERSGDHMGFVYFLIREVQLQRMATRLRVYRQYM